MEYDVIVVGGSFAGLSSSYFLAQKGLKVCLFERGKIGEFTKSTGILTKSVIKDLNVPDNLIETDIREFSIFSPKMVEYNFNLKKPLFYPSHTLDFLKWLKKLCMGSGVKIIENKFCRNIKIKETEVICEGTKGNMIVVASCFLPEQIRKLVPRETPIYYTGLEYVTDEIKTESNLWKIYLNYNISPGYFSWVAPINSKLSHVGIVKMNNNVSINKSITMFLENTGMKINKIIERRVGVVPSNGPRKKTYGNRFVLIGDAAGQIGPLSFAGINYAVRASRILSETTPSIIDKPNEANLKIYEEAWKQDFGGLLEEEIKLKKLYDRINTNEKFELFIEMLNSISKKRIYDVFERFTNLKKLRIKKTFFPYLLDLGMVRKTLQILK